MADITLSDGKEITFDLYKFTFDEYTRIFAEKDGDSVANEVICRSADIDTEYFIALPFPDNRKVFSAFFKKCREVMADPNLESASTSA